MAAITVPRKTSQMGAVPEPDTLAIGVSAGSTLYVGEFAATSSGYLVSATATTGLVFWGVIDHDQSAVSAKLDNTSGSNGAIVANVKRGVFKFANYASDPVTAIGTTCYCYDNRTVAATDGTSTRSACGTVYQIDSDGVWVKVGFNNTPYANATETTDGSMPYRDKLRVDRDHWAAVALTDASASKAISSGTWFVQPTSAALTTARTLTIVSGGAVSGDTMTIERLDMGASPLAISAGSTGIISYLRQPGFVDLQFQAEWVVKRKGTYEQMPNAATISHLSAQDIAISSGIFRTIPALSGNTTLTVVSGGAVSGDTITITRAATSGDTVAVSSGSGSGGTLFTMVAAKANHAKIRFDGLDWALVSCGQSS